MPTHKRLIISIVSSAAEKIIHKCCHWQPLITLSQHSKTHKTSYPLLAISPQRPHRQLEEKPAGPTGRYGCLDHHGVSVSVWSASVWRLLSRHRQTGWSSLSLRLHVSLPPIFQLLSLLCFWMCLHLLCWCFLYSFCPFCLCSCVFQRWASSLWSSAHTVSAFILLPQEKRVWVREWAEGREVVVSLSLSLSLEVAVEWRVHSRYVSLASSS